MAASLAEGQTDSVFERFTDHARRVMIEAQEESTRLRHGVIGTEHLLFGLVEVAHGTAARALAVRGVGPASVRQAVARLSPPGKRSPRGAPPFNGQAKTALELALREALSLQDNAIGTEHLLVGVAREGGTGADILADLGVDPVTLRIAELRAAPPAGAVDLAGLPAEPAVIAVGPAALVGAADAAALVGRLTPIDQRVERVEVDGVSYETCTYRPGPGPELTVGVAGARVTREAFDAYAGRTTDAEPVDGLGDAASWSAHRGTLRVLSGTTLVVIRVSRHPDPKGAAAEVARVALSNLA